MLRHPRNRLLFGIGLTLAPVLFLVNPPDRALSAEFGRELWASYFGSVLGLLGVVLLLWQFALGIRTIARLFSEDWLAINRLHKWLGITGLLLVLGHPLFVAVTYGTGILIPSQLPSTPFEIAVAQGRLALILLLVIGVSSQLVRRQLGFRWWRRLHWLTYPIPPLAFWHSMTVGTQLNTQAALRGYWWVLIVVWSAILLYRLGFMAGLVGKHRYRLVEKTTLAQDVTRYTFEPVGRGIRPPQTAQFAYLQPGLFQEAHPFTLSHFDPATGQLAQSIKASGPFTRSTLPQRQPGDTVRIDGPYGVFTQQPRPDQVPSVFIVGGIGITPFVRWAEQLGQWPASSPPPWLFYSNRRQADIAYLDLLRQAFDQQLVLSLTDEPVTEGAAGHWVAGFLSVDILQQHLPNPLTDYHFYVCGPPPMIRQFQTGLHRAGVPESQLHQELFGL